APGARSCRSSGRASGVPRDLEVVVGAELLEGRDRLRPHRRVAGSVADELEAGAGDVVLHAHRSRDGLRLTPRLSRLVVAPALPVEPAGEQPAARPDAV